MPGGAAAPAVSPSKWTPGQMREGSSPPLCRTPLPRGPHPYKRPSGPSCDAGERLPPSPSDPQLSIDLRKTALLRSLLLRTEVPLPLFWRGASLLHQAVIAG